MGDMGYRQTVGHTHRARVLNSGHSFDLEDLNEYRKAVRQDVEELRVGGP